MDALELEPQVWSFRGSTQTEIVHSVMSAINHAGSREKNSPVANTPC